MDTNNNTFSQNLTLAFDNYIEGQLNKEREKLTEVRSLAIRLWKSINKNIENFGLSKVVVFHYHNGVYALEIYVPGDNVEIAYGTTGDRRLLDFVKIIAEQSSAVSFVSDFNGSDCRSLQIKFKEETA